MLKSARASVEIRLRPGSATGDRVSLADLQSRPAHAAQRPGAKSPFAVVDIGSNSVRFVIYEGLKRSSSALYNEKKPSARSAATWSAPASWTAKASFSRSEALGTVSPFERRLHGIRHCEAVAAAAARDAQNGRAFIRRAEAALGCTIEILSGEEEARLAAEGVLAGIPNADGLTADLGGGSLDMVTVRDGHIGDAATLARSVRCV